MTTPDNKDDYNENGELPRKSEVASDVKRLKEAVLEAAEKRTPVPQPLFWSLFRSEVERIRKTKNIEATIKSIFKET